MVAFLGTGLLGAGFIKALLNKGQEVHIWNRSADKAKALESVGAQAFTDAKDAVKGARLVHIALSDDKAVDDVLSQASAGLDKKTIIIDHTTTTPEGAARRVQEWKDKGYAFIHAPVFMGPQNALEGTGTMLISGDQEVIKKIEGDLSPMTGKLVNLGDKPDKAAGMKLMGNLFLISMVGGLIDMLALAKSVGISVDEAGGLLEMWNPAAMLPARMKRIATGKFNEPSWHLSMARKDARLMMETAAKANVNLMVIPGMAQAMDKLIAEGHSNDDWMIIAKDAVNR